MSNITNLTTPLPPIPTRWFITPSDTTNTHCPTPTTTLLTFLATNILTSLLGLPLGSRLLIAKLSRSKFGKRFIVESLNSDPARWYTWILPFILQILANLSIAVMIHLTPGYEKTSIGDIMLLYLFRPRLSWVLLSVLRNFVVFQHSTKKFLLSKPGMKSLKHLWDRPGLWYEGVDLEAPWEPSAFSGTIAEILLQTIGVIYVMATWFRSPHAYFASLHWMILFMYVLPMLAVQSLFPLWPLAILSYCVVWAFFALMVLRAGELWCPPKLIAHAGIWTTFSVLGIATGSG